MGKAFPIEDVKDVGAADFYFCINATFAYIERNLGENALRQYWEDLGREYMTPFWMRWREGGLDAVADYLREAFGVEPRADVSVCRRDSDVVLEVRRCPAISHLRASRRVPIEHYCQHCYFVMDSAARRAGLAVRVRGGDGECRQLFSTCADAVPQDLMDIRDCASEVDDAREL